MPMSMREHHEMLAKATNQLTKQIGVLIRALARMQVNGGGIGGVGVGLGGVGGVGGNGNVSPFLAMQQLRPLQKRRLSFVGSSQARKKGAFIEGFGFVRAGFVASRIGRSIGVDEAGSAVGNILFGAGAGAKVGGPTGAIAGASIAAAAEIFQIERANARAIDNASLAEAKAFTAKLRGSSSERFASRLRAKRAADVARMGFAGRFAEGLEVTLGLRSDPEAEIKLAIEQHNQQIFLSGEEGLEGYLNRLASSGVDVSKLGRRTLDAAAERARRIAHFKTQIPTVLANTMARVGQKRGIE